ncbi:MAG: hypothetical protein R2912_08280 [Eubacteriales bacterium]
MKKAISIALAIMMIAFVMTGCAKAKDAATDAVSDAITAAENAGEAVSDGAASNDTQQSAPAGSANDNASEFVSAYMEAKSVALERLTDGLTNNPDTVMSTFSLLGISLSDLYLLPAMYFGLGESSVATALAMMGSKDVKYSESGNNYTITYKNSDDQETTMVGTYDKGRSLYVVGSTNGVEDTYFEAFRTSFGYVSQFYNIADDGTGTVYQIAVNGSDGTFSIATGVGRPAALTGNESADFPKAAKEWYSITGSTITGITAEGTSVNFEYVPSENEG